MLLKLKRRLLVKRSLLILSLLLVPKHLCLRPISSSYFLPWSQSFFSFSTVCSVYWTISLSSSLSSNKLSLVILVYKYKGSMVLIFNLMIKFCRLFDFFFARRLLQTLLMLPWIEHHWPKILYKSVTLLTFSFLMFILFNLGTTLDWAKSDWRNGWHRLW